MGKKGSFLHFIKKPEYFVRFCSFKSKINTVNKYPNTVCLRRHEMNVMNCPCSVHVHSLAVPTYYVLEKKVFKKNRTYWVHWNLVEQIISKFSFFVRTDSSFKRETIYVGVAFFCCDKQHKDEYSVMAIIFYSLILKNNLSISTSEWYSTSELWEMMPRICLDSTCIVCSMTVQCRDLSKYDTFFEVLWHSQSIMSIPLRNHIKNF